MCSVYSRIRGQWEYCVWLGYHWKIPMLPSGMSTMQGEDWLRHCNPNQWSMVRKSNIAFTFSSDGVGWVVIKCNPKFITRRDTIISNVYITGLLNTWYQTILRYFHICHWLTVYALLLVVLITPPLIHTRSRVSYATSYLTGVMLFYKKLSIIVPTSNAYNCTFLILLLTTLISVRPNNTFPLCTSFICQNETNQSYNKKSFHTNISQLQRPLFAVSSWLFFDYILFLKLIHTDVQNKCWFMLSHWYWFLCHR